MKGGARAVRKTLLSEGDEVDAFLLVTAKQELQLESPFFGDLHLSPNGGLYEVGDLFKPARYAGAVIFVAVLVLNVRSIAVRGVAAITSDGAAPENLFSFEQWLLSLAPHNFLAPEAVVAWFELVCLGYYLATILVDLCCVMDTRPRQPRDSYRYWSRLFHLFKEVAPTLQSFSAMKVLQYITPTILNADLYRMMRKFNTSSPPKSGARKLLTLLTFLFQRLFLFAFGFEAFLIKFRGVGATLSNPGSNEFRAVLQVLIFLNQMIGVVQLNMFANRRLLRFIFGGVDNFIDPAEHRKMCVWKAALMCRIWDAYRGSFGKFFAVAITFNDVDFQRLVLDDDAVEHLQSSTLKK